MLLPPGYADNADHSADNLQVILVCAGVILAAAAVAFVPVLIAWSRRHRRSGGIAASAFLWGALAAASAAGKVVQWMDYSRAWERRVMSGYADPLDRGDAPRLPWVMWAALAAAWVALVGWALSQRRPRPRAGLDALPPEAQAGEGPADERPPAV